MLAWAKTFDSAASAWKPKLAGRTISTVPLVCASLLTVSFWVLATAVASARDDSSQKRFKSR
jgi:hypothetical protein